MPQKLYRNTKPEIQDGCFSFEQKIHDTCSGQEKGK
jgi:hypothetical protein